MSNWERLKAKLSEPPATPAAATTTTTTTTITTTTTSSSSTTIVTKKKRKRNDISEAAKLEEETRLQHKEKETRLRTVEIDSDKLAATEKDLYIGLDCEMVGVGDNGERSALARVTMVDFDGRVIFDQHVRPSERITDFRTWVSGVKAKHLKEAISLKECIQKVGEIVRGKVLVGHALQNDLQVLMLQHPVTMIRDTARYRAYMKAHGREGGKLRPRKLKDLASEILGLEIQGGKHDSGEDARAAMLLYRAQRMEWEKELRKKTVHKYRALGGAGAGGKKKKVIQVA